MIPVLSAGTGMETEGQQERERTPREKSAKKVARCLVPKHWKQSLDGQVFWLSAHHGPNRLPESLR